MTAFQTDLGSRELLQADRVVKAAPNRMFRSAMALMISTGGTALLGVAFWGVAAHIYPAAAIGRSAAELSAMALLAQLASLNLGSAFVRYLAHAGSHTIRFVVLGYASCAVLAVAGLIVFLATSLSSQVLPGGVLFRMLFALAALLWTVFIVQDGILTALRKAVWVPVENLSFGAAKLLLLPLLFQFDRSQGVFFAWTLPVVVVVLWVNLYLARRAIPRHMSALVMQQEAEPFPNRRTLISFASAEYLTGVVSVSTTFLLPLIIVKRLGPVANAHFYLPWLGGVIFTNLLTNIASAFVVEASNEAHDPKPLFGRAIRLMLLITVPATLLTVLGSSVVLGFLSHGYANQGNDLLRWIGLSFPPHMVIILVTALLWVRRRIWVILAYNFVQAALLVALSWVFIGSEGISAPGIASLIAYGGAGVLSVPLLFMWRRRANTASVPS